MVERLHAEMARRTVEIAHAIEARAVAGAARLALGSSEYGSIPLVPARG